MANSVSRHDLRTSNPQLSSKISKYCGVDLSTANFTIHNNGETDVEIMDCVRGKDVFIVQSSLLHPSVQVFRSEADHRRASSPPLRHKPADKRKPIAAKVVADMLEVAGLHRIITIDVHSPQIQGFFNIPVDCLTAKHLFERWIRFNVPNWELSVVVSPDDGGTSRAGALADALQLPVAIIHRDRINEQHCVTGNVAGKQIILIDDLADTWRTINNAVKQLVNIGEASKVFILVTHAVISHHQIPGELFQREEVVKIVVTNTVKHEFGSLASKIEVIDTSEVIGEAIRRNHYGESLTTSQLV